MAGFFGFFDYTKPGPGVLEDEPKKTGIALFFDILGKRIWRLISLNLLYCAFSVPSLILTWAVSTFGASLALSFLGVDAISNEYADTIFALTVMLSILIYTFIGGGAPTAGATYIVRNYVRDTHAWVWSDFWEHFKSNFWLASAVFIIDCVCVALLMINMSFYAKAGAGNIAFSILQGLMIVLCLLFFLMHSYIYPLLVTFNLKLREVYKNAFLLTLAKLPRTFLAFLASFVVCGSILYGMFAVSPYFVLLLPIIYFMMAIYINLFITFPVIQKYMIDIPEQRKAEANSIQ